MSSIQNAVNRRGFMDFVKSVQRTFDKIENVGIQKRSSFSKSVYGQKNRELENCHKGKRCFVLGTDSSLKQRAIRGLENEVVFVTNDFFAFEEYDLVNPDYYLIFDEFYFSLENKKSCTKFRNDIEVLKKKTKKPVFILPVSARKMVEKFYKWNEWTDVYYVENVLNLYEGCLDAYDMTRCVTRTNVTVQNAILAATYMGVSEIYMMGIGRADLLDELKVYCGTAFCQYEFIDKKMSGEYFIKEAKKSGGLEDRILKCVKGMEDFKEIGSYCNKKNIKLSDCTPQSIVDGILHAEFESIF